MRPSLPFDPNHPRCKYPDEGRHFDAILGQSGHSARSLAKAVNIYPEVVRGYRRGFGRPSPTTKAKLERVLGVSLTPPVAPPAAITGTVTAVRDGDHMVFTMRVPMSEVLASQAQAA